MSRTHVVVLIVVAVLASACTASTPIVIEPAVAPAEPPAELAFDAAAAQSDEGSEEAADAAVVEPTRSPEPTPEPTWSPTISTPTASEQPDADSAPDQSEPEPEQGWSLQESGPDPVPTPTPVVALADTFPAGSCLEWTDNQPSSVVPCSGPHRAEVVAAGQLPYGTDAAFPSAEAFDELTIELCVTVTNDVGLVDVSNVVGFLYRPNLREWEAGDRSYVCFARFDQSVSGSLASIASEQQATQSAERAHLIADLQVHVGDCTSADAITKVPCSGPHSYVAIARTNLSSAGGVFPDRSLMEVQADEFCEREYANAGGVADAVAVLPNQRDWEEYGIHAIVCMAAVS